MRPSPLGRVSGGRGDDFLRALRKQDLCKLPGIVETLDWAKTQLALQCDALDEETIKGTLGVLLKYQDDAQKVAGRQLIPPSYWRGAS